MSIIQICVQKYCTKWNLFQVTEDMKESKVKNGEEVEPAKDAEAAESKTRRDFEELKLVKDIEEMKSKLNELELKLSQVSFVSVFPFQIDYHNPSRGSDTPSYSGIPEYDIILISIIIIV